MTQAAIFFCPSDDLTGDIISPTNRIELRCASFPNGSSEITPQVITVTEYCEVEDCTGLDVGTTPQFITQETFEAFWPFALLMLATGFGIRTIRRAISARA